jgi:hypothetical protein
MRQDGRTGRAEYERPTLPATHVAYLHDDGRWYRAKLVQRIWSGPDRRWRVLVTYSTAPGFTYTRGEWADSELLRPQPEHEQDPQTALAATSSVNTRRPSSGPGSGGTAAAAGAGVGSGFPR